MKGINFITGLPRSGSTLLCNILNQNPEFFASSTDISPELVSAVCSVVTNAPEVKGMVADDAEGTVEAIRALYRSQFDWQYAGIDKVVFSKSRGWAFKGLLMADVYTKFIITTRDLRSVFGSIEKQHRKTIVFDGANTPNDATISEKASNMLAPDGFVGQCVAGILDLVARMPDRVFVSRHEALTHDPTTHMVELYAFLGLDPFAHDFDDVKNVSTDPDYMHLNKFPHSGCGKVVPANRSEWQEFISPALAAAVFARYPEYNTTFGYQ